MDAGRSALQTDELLLLNRLYRRLWVAALAFHGAEAVGSAWLLLPLGPEASWALLLAYLVLKVGLWILLVATAVRLARVARSWWGLGPRSSALAVAFCATQPHARRPSHPAGFLGPREERLLAMGLGPMAPRLVTP